MHRSVATYADRAPVRKSGVSGLSRHCRLDPPNAAQNTPGHIEAPACFMFIEGGVPNGGELPNGADCQTALTAKVR